MTLVRDKHEIDTASTRRRSGQLRLRAGLASSTLDAVEHGQSGYNQVSSTRSPSNWSPKGRVRRRRRGPTWRRKFSTWLHSGWSTVSLDWQAGVFIYFLLATVAFLSVTTLLREKLDISFTSTRRRVSSVYGTRLEHVTSLQSPLEILFRGKGCSVQCVRYPDNSHSSFYDPTLPDYGNLSITFLAEEGEPRNIYRDLELDETEFRLPSAPLDDDFDGYNAHDDDVVRGNYVAFDNKGEADPKKKCRRIADHRLTYPTCNSVHEQDVLDVSSEFRFVNAGGYRDVFTMKHRYGQGHDQVAVKELLYDYDVDLDNFEFIRMDAIVAERLSASPRIYDIYDFCGMTIVSEYFYHGDIEGKVRGGKKGFWRTDTSEDEKGAQPHNNLSGVQKLVLALEMAEGLADLHGFSHGLVVHDDVQLSQYLLNKEMDKLKLNDFNRAEFPLWDEHNFEYCRYSNGKGHGNWRSPEEYMDIPLTEQIDVFSFGNNLYTLLTGLNPMYNTRDFDEVAEMVSSGKTAYIDPSYSDRSKPEARIAEIIEKCYAFEPEKRPSIFEIVRFLGDAAEECLVDGLSRESVLQSIAV